MQMDSRLIFPFYLTLYGLLHFLLFFFHHLYSIILCVHRTMYSSIWSVNWNLLLSSGLYERFTKIFATFILVSRKLLFSFLCISYAFYYFLFIRFTSSVISWIVYSAIVLSTYCVPKLNGSFPFYISCILCKLLLP